MFSLPPPLSLFRHYSFSRYSAKPLPWAITLDSQDPEGTVSTAEQFPLVGSHSLCDHQGQVLSFSSASARDVTGETLGLEGWTRGGVGWGSNTVIPEKKKKGKTRTLYFRSILGCGKPRA